MDTEKVILLIYGAINLVIAAKTLADSRQRGHESRIARLEQHLDECVAEKEKTERQLEDCRGEKTSLLAQLFSAKAARS